MENGFRANLGLARIGCHDKGRYPELLIEFLKTRYLSRLKAYPWKLQQQSQLLCQRL